MLWKLQIPSRRWNSETLWRTPGTENIHLDTESTNSKRKSPRHSWRFRRVLTNHAFLRLISGCRWSTRWFLVHFGRLQTPTSRWTERQTLHAERRIISYSTQVHWRNQGHSYNFGCVARKPHRWQLGHWWSKRFVWLMDRFHTIYFIEGKASWRIHVVRVEIDETASHIKAWSFVARNLDKYVEELLKWKRSKLGQVKDQSWKMPEDFEIFISLNLGMRNSRKKIGNSNSACHAL